MGRRAIAVVVLLLHGLFDLADSSYSIIPGRSCGVLSPYNFLKELPEDENGEVLWDEMEPCTVYPTDHRPKPSTTYLY